MTKEEFRILMSNPRERWRIFKKIGFFVGLAGIALIILTVFTVSQSNKEPIRYEAVGDAWVAFDLPSFTYIHNNNPNSLSKEWMNRRTDNDFSIMMPGTIIELYDSDGVMAHGRIIGDISGEEHIFQGKEIWFEEKTIYLREIN